MSARTIEQLDESNRVVEDDSGLRWLVAADIELRIPTWQRASAAGVVGIVYEFDKGWWAITAEDFVVTRSESFEGTYNLLDGGRHFDHFPSMSDLVIPPDATTKDTFVHLHTHSHYSPLDGLTTIEEMVESVKGHGQRAVAVTDHGICAGHPDLQLVADKHGIKPIFGLEAYFVEDRLERPAPGDKEAQERLSDYWHLILLAKDDEGLGNLWAASTESYRDGKYKKPRLDWDTLRRHHKGLIATSACLRGPLAHHGLGGQRSEPTEEEATATRARLGQLLEIFGEDFYIEIQTGQTPLQMTLNHRLIELAQEYNVPMIAAADSHYQLPTDKYAHQVWLRAQTNSDIAEDSSLFGSGDDYHISSEEEVRQDLASQGIPEDVIDVAIANTARIAEQCTAKIVARKDMPVYSKTGGHQADQDRLLDLCLKAWPKTVGKRHPHSVYETRLAKEFQLLKDKNYCGYFLVVWDYCRYARSKKILIGPGRGSGAGSLIAYLLGITGVDPVDSGLLFERFLTEGRMSLPDFDVDFPASKKREMQQYIRDRYGDQNVAVVGSSLKHKNKSIVKSLGMTLKSQLPADAFGDLNDVCKIIDMAEADTAGLGMSWEALWAQHDDVLRPYRQKYPEVFKLADRLVGRVRTYGQHAAGMVISPDGSLVNQLPMRAVKDESGEEHMVTQLDGATLEQLGFIKADLLTLRNLDTIQATIDLIRERRGLEVWPDDWRAEYEDPQVWEQICEAHTMGIFQIETRAGTQLVKRVQPTSLAELADIMTLVRPGPTRSGLTETYLRRRAGQEEVSYPDPRLEAVLADTYGAIIYQEQVMAATMELAGYTSTEADDVRRILGKKKVEKTQEAGQEFVSRATIDREVAEQLWLQMAEFAKYAFNKSHSYSYAALAYWTAWLKFHFPVEFLAMALSTVDKDRIPDFVKETRRMGYAVLPPDINRSGTGFRAADLGVRYGLDSIKGVGPAAVKSILENQEFETWEDFTSRRGRATHAGVVSLLAQVGAFDDLVPNRRGLVVLLQNEKDGTASQCVFKNTEVDGPGGLPCTFDWSTEPPNINPRTGKTLKPKPLPKKCTRACRNFTPSPPLDITAVQPYSRTQVRELEMNLLGVYLSSTPFDDLQPEDRQLTLSYAQALAQPGAPVKNYVVAGIITKARPYVPPSTGRTMGFVAMETEVETLDIAVFAPLWERFSRDLTVGTFGVAQIKHEDDGRNHLVDYQPVR